MPWNDSHAAKFFDDHFKGHLVECPDCKAVIAGEYSAFPTGGYYLDFACPKNCGSIRFKPNRDPRKAEFRPWTEQEKMKILNTHKSGQIPTCPVDESELHLDGPMGGKSITAICPRCLNRFKKDL